MRQWKHALVSMIPKPMNDTKRPENYRPISLLNTLSKLCERVIQSRLNNWINEKSILSNLQSGFVKGKQTNSHLFRLIESTLIGFNKGFKKGLKKATIFIDIEKAFDNVWHKGLLYKLYKYEVPKYLGKWIENYITSRTFPSEMWWRALRSEKNRSWNPTRKRSRTNSIKHIFQR